MVLETYRLLSPPPSARAMPVPRPNRITVTISVFMVSLLVPPIGTISINHILRDCSVTLITDEVLNKPTARRHPYLNSPRHRGDRTMVRQPSPEPAAEPP